MPVVATPPRIYFAASIRAGRGNLDMFVKIIKVLRNFGEVLTEHVGDPGLTASETGVSDTDIHGQDLAWLVQSDVVVAEVSTPSLGVGYEIGRAIENGKQIIVLHRSGASHLSAMIAGAPGVHVISYSDDEDALTQLRKVVPEHLHAGATASDPEI